MAKNTGLRKLLSVFVLVSFPALLVYKAVPMLQNSLGTPPSDARILETDFAESLRFSTGEANQGSHKHASVGYNYLLNISFDYDLQSNSDGSPPHAKQFENVSFSLRWDRLVVFIGVAGLLLLVINLTPELSLRRAVGIGEISDEPRRTDKKKKRKELEKPSVVTFPWLLKHISAGQWLGAVFAALVILVTVFVFGLKASQWSFVQEIFELNQDSQTVSEPEEPTSESP